MAQLADAQENDEKIRIRDLNDTFRSSGQGGRILMTSGVQALSTIDQSEVFQKIRLFDDFKEANDPYGEHDFGSIEHKGEKIFFKIDYYDRDLKNHSENPADPLKTARVMTVMLACEY